MEGFVEQAFVSAVALAQVAHKGTQGDGSLLTCKGHKGTVLF